MPQPVLGPCGGQDEPPCPPVSAVMQALADLVDANECWETSKEQLKNALAAAHAIIDPFRNNKTTGQPEK